MAFKLTCSVVITRKEKNLRINKKSKDAKYSYLTSERVQQVNDFFSKYNIQYDESSVIGQNVQRPGINAPFKKFSLLNLEGHTLKISGKTHS